MATAHRATRTNDAAVDALARRLARGLSPREALRAGGAALLGAVALSPTEALAAATGSCPNHRVRCHGRCCPPGEVCLPPAHKGGKHRCGCAAHKTRCDGKCVHVASDPHNCGRCGHACTTGQHCANGSCVPVCPAGRTACAGACVNLQTDPANCGGCGHVCASGDTCASGVCKSSCAQTGAACTFGSCCSGLVCDQSGHTCATLPACIGSACSSTCCAGAECDPHAVNPACRAPTGSPCNVDNDCGVEDYCNAGVCTAAKYMRGSGAYCDDLDDCLPSLTCDTTNFVCCAGDGAACPQGVECCAGSLCIQGTCAPACLSAGTACPGLTPCCTGLTCTGGVCTAPCIQSGGDCSTRPNGCCSGLICTAGGVCGTS